MFVHFVKGDLLKNRGCLAHTVSSDLKMSRGIAYQFKSKFGRIDILRKQRRHVGDTPYITDRGRKIFYLITKSKYWEKPELYHIEEALENLKKELIKKNIKSVSMPKIATGLDRQDWMQVYSIIIRVFNQTDITLNIYKL